MVFIEKDIFRDTYNFLLKYSNDKISQSEWQNCMKEMTEINQRYNCALCSRMLVITFCHIVRLQEQKTGEAWNNSEIKQFCEGKLN